jgi:peroxiredoxin
MARTLSNMLPLGTKAPHFELQDTISGTLLNIENLKGKHGTVILFICNHCPFVIHVNSQLVKMANDYAKSGIGFIAISSNDADKYPQDGPENMNKHAKNENYGCTTNFRLCCILA